MKMESRSRAIDKIYKRRDKIEIPDFQREEVWDENKKQLLIDSILKGWHLPKFYFRKTDDTNFECVDGQQRLNAIFDFFENNLSLNPASASKFGGSKYEELPDDLSDAFDDFEIEIEEIDGASEEELEELFKRLQLGTPLNTAEKINAISGELRNFCHDISKKSFFSERIALSNTRYTHFETVVKWAFIEARGIQPQVRYAQLDSFLRENKSFSHHSDTARKISASVEFLSKAFPSKSSYLRTRANTLSVCMLASRVINAGLASDVVATEFNAFINKFFSDLSLEVQKGVNATDKELIEYQQAVTSGSTSGTSLNSRIRILTKRLATSNPIFNPLLSTYHEIGSEIQKGILELSSKIQANIFRINQSYSSVHGQDLFKMTNESAKFLTEMSSACSDLSSYGKFIDGLYFLVYEGSGACGRFQQPPPEITMQIKFLRNALRHDEDHGSPSDIRTKRLRAAEIFEKHSGKKTPEECGPDELIGVQSSILKELNAALSSI